MPQVSIVIPTYNRRAFLQEALGSVFSQTFTDYEVIVVDDGSTDDTAQFLASLQHPSLSVVSAPHTGNISAARNSGLRRATGEFIACLDSDDLWHPDKLSRQVAMLKNDQSIGLVATNSESFFIYPVIDKQARGGATRKLSVEDVLFNLTPIYPSSILYRRKCLDTVGMHDENFRWNDLGFIAKIVSSCGAAMDEARLTYVRRHGDNISTVLRAEAVGFRDMIATTEALFRSGKIDGVLRKKSLARFYLNMGKMLVDEKQVKAARAAFTEALRYDSGKHRPLLHLIRSYLAIPPW